MSEVEIKNATHADIGTIKKLADKIWHAHYHTIISVEQIDFMLATMYSEKTIAQQMDNGYLWTVAFVKNEALGFLSANHLGNGNYFLNKIYVDTSFHKKGVGKLLLDDCILKCEAIKTLRLQVNRKNSKAIDFYLKNGFVIEESKDFDIGNGYFMNDFIMLKNFTDNR